MLTRFSPLGWLGNLRFHLRELAHRRIVLEVDRVADILRRQALVVDVLHGVWHRVWHRVQLDLRHGGPTLARGRSGGLGLGCTCMVDVEVEIRLEAGHWRHLGGVRKIAIVAQRQ